MTSGSRSPLAWFHLRPTERSKRERFESEPVDIAVELAALPSSATGRIRYSLGFGPLPPGGQALGLEAGDREHFDQDFRISDRRDGDR